MKDLHSNIKVSPAIDPAAIIAGNATKTGNTIDVNGYGSLEFIIISGAITDSTFTTTMYHGDESDMSDEEAVADADLIGTEPVLVATDDSETHRVGYKGSKRYVRIKVVQTGATTGGFLCAVAIQGHPERGPVA